MQRASRLIRATVSAARPGFTTQAPRGLATTRDSEIPRHAKKLGNTGTPVNGTNQYVLPIKEFRGEGCETVTVGYIEANHVREEMTTVEQPDHYNRYTGLTGLFVKYDETMKDAVWHSAKDVTVQNKNGQLTYYSIKKNAPKD